MKRYKIYNNRGNKWNITNWGDDDLDKAKLTYHRIVDSLKKGANNDLLRGLQN